MMITLLLLVPGSTSLLPAIYRAISTDVLSSLMESKDMKFLLLVPDIIFPEISGLEAIFALLEIVPLFLPNKLGFGK